MTKEDYNKLFNTSVYDWFMSLSPCNQSKRIANAVKNDATYVLTLIYGGQTYQQEERIVMMSDFVQMTPTDLFKLRNIGRTVFEYIENTLAEYGLRLGMSKQEVYDLGYISDYDGYRKCTLEIFVPEETFLFYGQPDFEAMMQEKVQRLVFDTFSKKCIVNVICTEQPYQLDKY